MRSRDMVMICIVYPIVVAMGALMLSDGNTLLGVLQIAFGLCFMGLRIALVLQRRTP